MCKSTKNIRTVECASVHSLCSGSARALDMVCAALESGDQKLYCLHELLHNRSISRMLKERGMIEVGSLSEIPALSTIVISAHGAPPRVFTQAGVRGINILDATCPLVKELHQRAAAVDKAPLILVGHAGHPEVEGILGYAPNAVVVGGVEDVARLPNFGNDSITVIAQTTFESTELEQIKAALYGKYSARMIDRAMVCPATGRRQRALLELAQRCDLVLVVGSGHSSNSRRLVECATRAGTNAVLVDGTDEINQEMFKGVMRLGLSAGASVGDAEFAEVLARLKEDFMFVEIRDKAKTSEDAIL